MDISARQRKLAYAEKQLKATRRRINRLMTAQANWQRRVIYHSSQLEQEQLVRFNELKLGTIQGRKFRD